MLADEGDVKASALGGRRRQLSRLCSFAVQGEMVSPSYASCWQNESFRRVTMTFAPFARTSPGREIWSGARLGERPGHQGESRSSAAPHGGRRGLLKFRAGEEAWNGGTRHYLRPLDELCVLRFEPGAWGDACAAAMFVPCRRILSDAGGACDRPGRVRNGAGGGAA